MTRTLPVLLLTVFLLFSPALSSAASKSDSSRNTIVNALIDREKSLAEKCRGGYGDSYETKKYCREREAAAAELKKQGWCWGYPGQVEADKVWHDCKEKPPPETLSPYYLSLDAWECQRPGSLVDNHMSDPESQCIPPARKKPENVAVMDVQKDFAYVCTPLRTGMDIPEGFTAIQCSYVLVVSIVDKNGQHPDPAQLAEYAARQTMKAVKDLK